MIELSEEYLSRFPIQLRECLLRNKKEKEAFKCEVCDDFPDYIVYRAIHSNDRIDENDFLGNAEEADVLGLPFNNRNRQKHKWHAVSVNESLEMLKYSTKFPNEKRKLLGIAKGIMKAMHGPADFKKGATHHNWYLYENENKIVVNDFEVIEIE